MMRRRRHGGSRAGSGRKRRSETLGPPQGHSITNYFTSPTRANTATPNRTDNTPELPVQNPATATTATNVTTETPPRPNTATTHNPNATAAQADQYNRPNCNADDMFDETVFIKGRKKKESSINLKIQQAEIVDKSFYEKAYSNIEQEGILWFFPPAIIRKPKHELQDRWLDFFKLRVFNWIPEAMISRQWKPKCPNCNKELTKHGNKAEPRLVFDAYDNYWLNAPNRYYCKDCHDRSSDGINYTFRSTSPGIMEQLKSTHPELLDLFPCHMTALNAIDKKLFNSIVHNAVKGIGPTAMRENIVSLHELEWQKRVNAWARHIIDEVNKPFGTHNIDRNSIEKCPEYFSSKMGCVCSQW